MALVEKEDSGLLFQPLDSYIHIINVVLLYRLLYILVYGYTDSEVCRPLAYHLTYIASYMLLVS